MLVTFQLKCYLKLFNVFFAKAKINYNAVNSFIISCNINLLKKHTFDLRVIN